jgi:hypothetical protein
MEISVEWMPVSLELKRMKAQYEQARQKVAEMNDNEILDLHARRLVEMAAYIIMTYLLVFDAMRCNCDSCSLKDSVRYFLRHGRAVSVGHFEYLKEN